MSGQTYTIEQVSNLFYSGISVCLYSEIFRMKILITALFLLTFAFAVNAQNICPANLVCITQEAAQKAVENARLVPALQNENAVLKEQVAVEKQNVRDVREAANKNEVDLKAALARTELELARTNGILTGVEKANIEQRAIIQAILPLVRKKCVVSILFC